MNINTWQDKVASKSFIPSNYDPAAPDIPPSEQEKREKYFDEIQLGIQTQPCIVVDRFGRIILWYLPDILDPVRVVRQLLSPSVLPFALM